VVRQLREDGAPRVGAACDAVEQHHRRSVRTGCATTDPVDEAVTVKADCPSLWLWHAVEASRWRVLRDVLLGHRVHIVDSS
jgi:hypothetical protein